MNFNTTALVQAIRPRVIGMKKGMSKSSLYISISKESVLVLSCAVYAMSKISELITGENILKMIERRYPLVNMIGLSFSLLFSLEVFYSKLYYHYLLVDNTQSSSKFWLIELFKS